MAKKLQSSLFKCRVFHRRFSPKNYGFTSNIFMWWLDLDELDYLVKDNPLISRNKPNVYSFYDHDHLYLGEKTLKANALKYLQKMGVKKSPSRIFLLTNLKTFGYVFNPVSFYFCYDKNNTAFAVIVEVHNTFGELKPFILRPEDLQKKQFIRRQNKHFYISPFSHLDHELEIKAEIPSDKICLKVNDYEKGEAKPFFCSSLTGSKTELSLKNLIFYSIQFPLITLKIISAIHWHAFKLYLLKVPFHQKNSNPELQKDILPKKHQIKS